jgi:hypothetical protein
MLTIQIFTLTLIPSAEAKVDINDCETNYKKLILYIIKDSCGNVLRTFLKFIKDIQKSCFGDHFNEFR